MHLSADGTVSAFWAIFFLGGFTDRSAMSAHHSVTEKGNG